jgi:hypothetical protein
VTKIYANLIFLTINGLILKVFKNICPSMIVMGGEIILIIIFILFITCVCFILMECECCECYEDDTKPMSEDEEI